MRGFAAGERLALYCLVIALPKRPEPRSRFVLVICIMVLMALIGAQMFLSRAGAQKKEEKPMETKTTTETATESSPTQKTSGDELEKKLTPQQYHVTQECGTEPHSTMPIGTITLRGFTSMLSPASRSSLHSINLIAAVAGPVLPNRLQKNMSSRNQIGPSEWSGRKSAARRAVPISATFLMMVPVPLARVTASTPPRFDSFQSKS